MSARIRALAVAVGFALVFVARWVHLTYRAPAGGPAEPLLPYCILGGLIVLILLVLDAPPATPRISEVVVRALAAALLVAGAGAMMLLLSPGVLPRFVILLASVLTFAWITALGGWLTVRTVRRGAFDRVVAIVAVGDADALTADAADTDGHERRFVLVACLPPDIDASAVHDIADTDVLVLGPEAQLRPELVAIAERLHTTGARVRSLDDFYDEWLGRLPVSSLDRFALMRDIESLHGNYAPVKRSIDLVFAAIGSIALLLLIPVVLVGNLLGNRGPLLFRQQRVGKGNAEFSIWKLRTMDPGADDVSGWTSNSDPRITPWGKVLRRTHVDELPQVVNIFAGQLSIVGPRPEQVRYVRQLEQSLPLYAARHRVTPGLTGWAQVKYRYAASEEDAYTKLQYDLHYLRHESLATDLRIIWMTVRQVFTLGGR